MKRSPYNPFPSTQACVLLGVLLLLLALCYARDWGVAWMCGLSVFALLAAHGAGFTDAMTQTGARWRRILVELEQIREQEDAKARVRGLTELLDLLKKEGHQP